MRYHCFSACPTAVQPSAKRHPLPPLLPQPLFFECVLDRYGFEVRAQRRPPKTLIPHAAANSHHHVRSSSGARLQNRTAPGWLLPRLRTRGGWRAAGHACARGCRVRGLHERRDRGIAAAVPRVPVPQARPPASCRAAPRATLCVCERGGGLCVRLRARARHVRASAFVAIDSEQLRASPRRRTPLSRAGRCGLNSSEFESNPPPHPNSLNGV